MAALLASAIAAAAQMPQFDSGERSLKRDTAAVEFLFPEQVTVPAGKPTAVALHFRVAPGLHINSHTPKDDYLIPTAFSIPSGAAATLRDAAYPKGVDMALPADPKTVLNVYTGDFIINAHLIAQKGNHLVEAKLRYQACDNNACMPPKTITVTVDVIGQ
jgi:hypothetical protein